MVRVRGPLLSQRHALSFKAVHIRCLDLEKRPVANASGFIRREQGKLFLYTCWHVVTGFDRNDLRIGMNLPNRVYIEVSLKNAQTDQPGVTRIGGCQSWVIPLYDPLRPPRRPLWLQDRRHVPNEDLNSVGLFVPFWHDAVKVALPPNIQTANLQVIEEDDVFPSKTMLVPGDKLYIVGYPYGYSAFGHEQPTPVVLTRFVAARGLRGRQNEILLDGAGAPAMSGGPVFIERGEDIFPFGMYTGLIYPDHTLQTNEKVTALGTCSDMSLHFWGDVPMVSIPDES